MTRVLVADDDTALCEMLREYFAIEGIGLDAVHAGDQVVEALRRRPYDLLVLDVMLPGRSGLDVLKQLRQADDLPVLMLSARGEELDRVLGLELGADDFIAKPFSLRELVARVRTILRRRPERNAAPAAADPERLEVGDLVLDLRTRVVACAGRRLAVTGAEFAVLAELMRHPGQVLDKRALCLSALGRRPAPFDRSIDMHVSNLRRKLGPDADGQSRIAAVRGAGYVLAGAPTRTPG